jgi:hypothetical protein
MLHGDLLDMHDVVEEVPNMKLDARMNVTLAGSGAGIHRLTDHRVDERVSISVSTNRELVNACTARFCARHAAGPDQVE